MAPQNLKPFTSDYKGSFLFDNRTKLYQDYRTAPCTFDIIISFSLTHERSIVPFANPVWETLFYIIVLNVV